MKKKEQLIEITEKLIRERGYNGFSIKDLANTAGIKTSSVHYYFPEKKDLGVCVAQRYTETFKSALEKIDKEQSLDKILHEYASLFEKSYMKDKHLCLCAVLASEKGSLPEAVSKETKNFFEENLKWLTETFSKKGAKAPMDKALLVLSTFEGTLLLSNSLESDEVLGKIFKQLNSIMLAVCLPQDNIV